MSDIDPTVTPTPAAADPAAELQNRIKTLQAENRRFKEEEEQARKARLPLQSQIAELRKEAEDLQQALLRDRIGRSLGLPEALISRLQGSDEDALRADAEELKRHIAKPQNSGNPHQGKRVYKASELNDRRFYLENEKDILAAYREGRIIKNA